MALVQITDPAFPGAKSIDFIGQMIVYVEPMGRFWGWSGLTDALAYNALDVAQAETSPDRIVGLCVSNNEVLIFGERTIEPWAFSPTATATFQLRAGSVIESGCGATASIKRIDNSVMYLTNNGQVARLEGYTPRVVSTMAIEADIRSRDWSKAFAYTWEDNGHCVYYLTFPDGHTWGYDVRQGKWHRRESYGLDRWRVNALIKSGGKWLAGDFQSGRVYELEWGYVYEACEIMPRKLRTGVLHANGNRVTVNALRLNVATGGERSVPNCDEPTAVYRLLVTGGDPGDGGPMMAKAMASDAPEFVGIAQSDGADKTGVAAYSQGVFAVGGAGRYSTDSLETFQPSTDGANATRIVGGHDGFFASNYELSIYTVGAWTAPNPPATWASAGITGAAVLEIGYARGLYWWTSWGQTYSSPSRSGPWTLRTTDGTMLDICDHDGDVYAIFSRGFNGHAGDTSYHSIYRYSDETLSDGVMLLSRAHAETCRPTQLCSGFDENGDPVLVAYCFGGGTWTSADNWTTWVDPGVPGTTGPNSFPGGGDNIYQVGGRRIASAGRYFYVISGNYGTGDRNTLAVSADGGLTYGAPIELPINHLISIAAGADV